MIAAIRARLAGQVPALKLIGGAAEYQTAADSRPQATPAVFVILLRESAEPSVIANDCIQRVTAHIGLLIVVRNVADPRGDAAQQDLQPLRAAIKTALLGWEPLATHAPLERSDSSLLAFHEGHLWWQDSFLTTYYDRSIT